MTVWQSFILAVEMLRRHKLRALLTMLGVIIGVMSVTVIVMISAGFSHFMTSQFERLGADTIIIAYDPGGQWQGPVGAVSKLSLEDVDYLMSRVQGLDIASAMLMVPAQKVFRGDLEVKNPRIFATDENMDDLNRLKVQEGRHMSAADVRARANICVVGPEIRDRLFPDKRALGKLVSFSGITLEVVGILESLDIMGETTDRDVWVPITTAQDKWLGGDQVTFITTRPKEGVSVDDAMDHVWRALMLKTGNRPIFRVESRQAILNIMGLVIGVAGAILAAIAALSLLVGGIGIMNIMLVSVTERTKEVGLRKAVGAKNSAVLIQFLVESATLSLVGGLIGMGVAYTFGSVITIITAIFDWPLEGGLATPFPVIAALSSAGFSALIGVVFGLYPAVRAAKLTPVEALRAE